MERINEKDYLDIVTKTQESGLEVPGNATIRPEQSIFASK